MNVSIATCTYNRPEFLRLAVESLRAQTNPDWEHLLYDNGSTDPHVAEVLTWAAEDPRVRVWRGEVNRDQPAVFWNFLLDRAQGKYLTTLDDDDEKLPRFVEIMSNTLDQNPEIDLVTCGFIVRTAEEKEWEHQHNLQTTPEEVDRASTCAAGALLYRREAFVRVGPFSETIHTNEDWEWVRRAVRILKIKNLPECLMLYRQHTTNRLLRAEALGHSEDVKQILHGAP